MSKINLQRKTNSGEQEESGEQEGAVVGAWISLWEVHFWVVGHTLAGRHVGGKLNVQEHNTTTRFTATVQVNLR